LSEAVGVLLRLGSVRVPRPHDPAPQCWNPTRPRGRRTSSDPTTKNNYLDLDVGAHIATVNSPEPSASPTMESLRSGGPRRWTENRAPDFASNIGRDRHDDKTEHLLPECARLPASRCPRNSLANRRHPRSILIVSPNIAGPALPRRYPIHDCLAPAAQRDPHQLRRREPSSFSLAQGLHQSGGLGKRSELRRRSGPRDDPTDSESIGAMMAPRRETRASWVQNPNASAFP
jgi:hypothetical protein